MLLRVEHHRGRRATGPTRSVRIAGMASVRVRLSTRALRPGLYWLRATAVDALGRRSTARRIAFRVLR